MNEQTPAPELMSRRAWLYRHLPPTLVLCAGIGLSFVFFAKAHLMERERAIERFSHQSAAYSSALQTVIDSNLLFL